MCHPRKSELLLTRFLWPSDLASVAAASPLFSCVWRVGPICLFGSTPLSLPLPRLASSFLVWLPRSLASLAMRSDVLGFGRRSEFDEFQRRWVLLIWFISCSTLSLRLSGYDSGDFCFVFLKSWFGFHRSSVDFGPFVGDLLMAVYFVLILFMFGYFLGFGTQWWEPLVVPCL
jgi:hypothetical protein